MVAWMGQPIVASLMPKPSSTSICPAGVAPPWLPMAGTMKGSPPDSLTSATSLAAILSMLATPRLPKPRAMRLPFTALARFKPRPIGGERPVDIDGIAFG